MGVEWSVSNDSVLVMLHEMRPEIVEQNFVVPMLDELFKCLGVKADVNLTHHRKFVLTVVADMAIVSDDLSFAFVGSRGIRYFFGARFAIQSCGHLANLEGIPSLALSEAFVEKYRRLVESDSIDLQTSPYAKEFIDDLALTHGFFSLATRKKLVDIRDALVQKASRGEKSLEKILEARQPKRARTRKSRGTEISG